MNHLSSSLLLEHYQKLQSSLLKSLTDIVAIPSVLSQDTTSTAPFGKEIDRCLDTTLAICNDLGFSTFKDPKGYYGYAEYGTGQELIGVLCHLDIVPVEDPKNWLFDPFTLIQQGDKLIARGVADDKAPTVVCMYALKTLIDLGITFNKRIRLIFGTDEENLWRCIYKYIKKEEIPSMGFTPDGEFPVICAEKGLLQFIVTGKGENITIKGGGSFNAVPLSIDYDGEKQEELILELQKRNFEFQQHDSYITIQGKAVHAQSTEKGINPIARLMICLRAIGLSSPSIDFVAQKIRDNPYGELLFGTIEDEASGKLKTNLARVDITPEYAKLYFDFRIPVTHSMEELVISLKKTLLNYSLEYQLYDNIDPLYIPQDDPLIKTLCAIYYEETNTTPKPISTGGATYSRAMKNFATYGMNFPHSEKTAHQTNESISLQDLEKAFIIYAKAIFHLNNL